MLKGVKKKGVRLIDGQLRAANKGRKHQPSPSQPLKQRLQLLAGHYMKPDQTSCTVFGKSPTPQKLPYRFKLPFKNDHPQNTGPI